MMLIQIVVSSIWRKLRKELGEKLKTQLRVSHLLQFENKHQPKKGNRILNMYYFVLNRIRNKVGLSPAVIVIKCLRPVCNKGVVQLELLRPDRNNLVKDLSRFDMTPSVE